MSKIITYIIGSIIVTSVIIGLFLYGTFSWGFVCLKLYNWFVLPLGVQGLPTLTLVQMIGLCLFFKAIGYHGSVHLKDEYEDKYKFYISVFLLPWLTLLFAFILKILLF